MKGSPVGLPFFISYAYHCLNFEKVIHNLFIPLSKRLLEICVDSLPSALIAQEAGADRIELCSGLDVGGLTPDHALFTLARNKLSIPIHVLIRPRSGNFVYDILDLEVMTESIHTFKSQGADGLVVGALTEQQELDKAVMRQLLKAAEPLPVTFHRAFDQLEQPLEALSFLMEEGVQRILTSGQQTKAIDGIPLLQQVVEKVAGKLIVLPGGGVSSQNVEQLLAVGMQEVHASARQALNHELKTNNKVSLSAGTITDAYRFADFQEIVNLRTILDHYEA